MDFFFKYISPFLLEQSAFPTSQAIGYLLFNWKCIHTYIRTYAYTYEDVHKHIRAQHILDYK